MFLTDLTFASNYSEMPSDNSMVTGGDYVLTVNVSDE